MSNQYTIARAEGLLPGDDGYPQGANQFTAGTRQEHPEDVRRRIQVSKIIGVVQNIVEDETADKSHRLAASKLLLDKSLSSLSSVDQTVRDETAESPEQIEAKLRMLIERADPALLSRLLGERASQVTDNYPKAVNQDRESSN